MANAKLITDKGAGNTYIIEGLLRLNFRKSQMTPPLPVPTQADDITVLTAVMGQVLEITGDFSLFDRSDDYTDGTGSPGVAPYTIQAQREYLLDTIFSQSSRHQIVLTDGTTVYYGRLQDIEFGSQGDDPLSDSVTFKFTRGLAF
jgi:hypothetical protein